MVAQEDSWEHARGHVAIRAVLWPFRGLLVEHALKEPYGSLAEVTASKRITSWLAVLADIHGVEGQADVLLR